MMAGQDMDMKTVVGAITNKSDLYITVKENVQAVMNANVCYVDMNNDSQADFLSIYHDMG